MLYNQGRKQKFLGGEAIQGCVIQQVAAVEDGRMKACTQGANPSVCHWFFAADCAFVHSKKWMMSVVTKIGEKKLDQPICSAFEVLLHVLSHFSL